IPFVTQAVLIFQEKYLVNFEFVVTELGWSYHVVSYELPLIVVGSIFVGYLLGIVVVLFNLMHRTKLPVLKKKYTLLFVSFLIFQVAGTTFINALISLNVLTSNFLIGGILQFLTFISIWYALTLKERELPLTGIHEKDFYHVYSSFLTILYNSALKGQLGEEAFKFTDFISQSHLKEHVTLTKKRIIFDMKKNLDIIELISRNLRIFDNGFIDEAVVDQYLRVLNCAQQYQGKKFDKVVKENEAVLKKTDLIYGLAGGKYLEKLKEDNSLRELDDLTSCLKIYKRVLLPVMGRVPEKEVLLHGFLVQDMEVTLYNEILMERVKERAYEFREDQRLPLIIENLNAVVSRLYKYLLTASSVDVEGTLQTLRSVLLLNMDRANDLGMYPSLLEKLVAEIPEPHIYDLYLDYLEEQVGERTRKIEDSEKRYRVLIETEKDLIYTLDDEGNIVFANPALETILFYRQEEVLGQKFVDFVYEEWRERALIDFHDLMEKGEIVSETVLVDKKGFPHFMEYSSKIIKKDNLVVGSIGIARDITERKRIEDALKEHEERLSVLLENSPDIIMNIDEEGTIRYINRIGPGFNDENAIGTKAFEYIKRDYHERFREALKRAFDLGQPGQFECVFLDNTWWETRLVPIKQTDEVISAMLICTNITERKNLQEKILQTEKLAAIGQLASSISHEIRNPLGVIKNSCYFLRMKSNDETDQKILKHLRIIDEEVNSANLIVSDLLDFARNTPPIYIKANIQILILSALANIVVPNNVQVITKFCEFSQMFLDKEQIRRVFLNMIRNAVQAMPEGGKLEIQTNKLVDSLQIVIKDGGVGISKENLLKLFTPFFSTKAKGVGLGLTICKQIVEGHGGKIVVKSEVGKGSSFTIVLPFKRMVGNEG
ncbi:MAG: PAS domain S-box protein, partial [Candidatus Bathyarchaeota archaeon]|nr:PAS domain S-box protein [Candidatus Bathyarchaeota archaeon]